MKGYNTCEYATPPYQRWQNEIERFLILPFSAKKHLFNRSGPIHFPPSGEPDSIFTARKCGRGERIAAISRTWSMRWRVATRMVAGLSCFRPSVLESANGFCVVHRGQWRGWPMLASRMSAARSSGSPARLRGGYRKWGKIALKESFQGNYAGEYIIDATLETLMLVEILTIENLPGRFIDIQSEPESRVSVRVTTEPS